MLFINSKTYCLVDACLSVVSLQNCQKNDIFRHTNSASFHCFLVLSLCQEVVEWQKSATVHGRSVDVLCKDALLSCGIIDRSSGKLKQEINIAVLGICGFRPWILDCNRYLQTRYRSGRKRIQ